MTMGLDVADARTRRAVEASRSEASASMTSADEDDRIGRARSVTRPRVDDDDDDAFGASRVFERLARARGPARAIEGARDIARAGFFRPTSRDGA
jgi:hypothetical protein